MVTAQGLHPPDLVGVGKRHAVHLIGAVLLEQRCGAKDALARTVDIGQYECDEILFSDAAGLFGSLTVSRLIDNQRICAEDSLVGSDGLSGSHGYVCGVDAGACPDALIGKDIRN